jgi:hypothetical protein
MGGLGGPKYNVELLAVGSTESVEVRNICQSPAPAQNGPGILYCQGYDSIMTAVSNPFDAGGLKVRRKCGGMGPAWEFRRNCQRSAREIWSLFRGLRERLYRRQRTSNEDPVFGILNQGRL